MNYLIVTVSFALLVNLPMQALNNEPPSKHTVGKWLSENPAWACVMTGSALGTFYGVGKGLMRQKPLPSDSCVTPSCMQLPQVSGTQYLFSQMRRGAVGGTHIGVTVFAGLLMAHEASSALDTKPPVSKDWKGVAANAYCGGLMGLMAGGVVGGVHDIVGVAKDIILREKPFGARPRNTAWRGSKMGAVLGALYTVIQGLRQ